MDAFIDILITVIIIGLDGLGLMAVFVPWIMFGQGAFDRDMEISFRIVCGVAATCVSMAMLAFLILANIHFFS